MYKYIKKEFITTCALMFMLAYSFAHSAELRCLGSVAPANIDISSCEYQLRLTSSKNKQIGTFYSVSPLDLIKSNIKGVNVLNSNELVLGFKTGDGKMYYFSCSEFISENIMLTPELVHTGKALKQTDTIRVGEKNGEIDFASIDAQLKHTKVKVIRLNAPFGNTESLKSGYNLILPEDISTGRYVWNVTEIYVYKIINP